jgi:hypothetical protein
MAEERPLRPLLWTLVAAFMLLVLYRYFDGIVWTLGRLGLVWESIRDATLDYSKPLGLSDGFVLNVWSSFIGTIVQLVVTYFLVSWIFSRKQQRIVAKTRIGLANRLRDELFDLVVLSTRDPQAIKPDRIGQLIQRSGAFLDTAGWHSCLRFEEAVNEYLRNPGDKYQHLVLRGRFDDALKSLGVGSMKREIYTDRLDVAQTYR